MAEETKISWAHSTLNYWIGCTKVSEACDHCYAEAEWADRRKRVVWGPHGDRSPTKTWNQPYKWQREAGAFYAAHGSRRRVFVNSLSDFGDNHRSIRQSWRNEAFRAWRQCPDLDFLILTKRPQNLLKPGYLPADWGSGYANVWLGTTVENQAQCDLRVPLLGVVPAALRFLSMEPLLELVDLPRAWMPQIGWILVGGESGKAPRHMNLGWPRSLRAQARATGTMFHMKQLSQADQPYSFKKFEYFPADLQVREVP